MRITGLLLLTLLLIGVFCCPAHAEDKKVFFELKDGVLSLAIDGKPFTTYHYMNNGDDPKFLRPYFWPVLTSDGTEVTSDQTRLKAKEPKADHSWHRSIWVGWGDVNGYDHWTAKKWQQRHVDFKEISGHGFVEDLTWDGETPEKPVLTETRVVTFKIYPDGSRGIEIDSTLTAVNGDAVFKCAPLTGNSVEAGLIATRVAKEISADPKKVMTSAAGVTGEKDCRDKNAGWCDYSGTINGKIYGIGIVSAKDNPGGDFPWHIRAQGLFAQIGPLQWTLKNGESTTYKHLIVIHTGDATAAAIADKAKEWRGE